MLIKNELTKIQVPPANSIDECVSAGLFPEGTYLSDNYIELVKLNKSKLLYLIPNIGVSCMLEKLAINGLKFCSPSPNYLLGLVKYLSENKHTFDLSRVSFISLDDESRFMGDFGEVIMHISYVEGKAGLWCSKYRGPHWNTTFLNNWFFLAEEIN